jgi:hypothetical protein
MKNDPFAVRSALRTLEQFVEGLAAELRDRRARLEGALCDLLLVWEVEGGPHELAVRLAAVGDAVRDAGLLDEVTRLHAVRAATADPVAGAGGTIALALLDAAAAGQQDRVADLLAGLHMDHAGLLPDVNHRLDCAAGHLLVVWSDRHSKDVPDRFAAELRRLGIDRHLVERWQWDHSPELSDTGERVLDALLDGLPFAVGWLVERIDLNADEDVVTDTRGSTGNRSTTSSALRGSSAANRRKASSNARR